MARIRVVGPQPLVAHAGKGRLPRMPADVRRRGGEQCGDGAEKCGGEEPSEEVSGQEGQRSFGHASRCINLPANR